jgi:predicted NACHT family NTPase
MAKRSLKASAEGIRKARKAYNAEGLTQEALAEQVNLKTRQPVSNFFASKPIDRHVFIEICTALDLNWEEIRQQETEDGTSEDAVVEAIAEIVQAIREQIRPLVKAGCGEMKVLDMTQPIELTGEQGIYTNVNILEKITARNRREIAQLLQNAGSEEFDRAGLSRVREERIAGIEAVKRHSKLMVLGKPGAGKTTFLKYLAMQCIDGNFLGDRVPLFITLKDFAETKDQPDFLDYIREKITNSATQTQIENLIQQGKAFILLDGLDEVREEDTGRVLRDIRDFSDRYADNHFVITCRIAAKEYVFERFTEVEVADFDDEQISTFIHNWFRCKDPEKGEEFAEQIIEKLDKNKPIKELASSPLLLTLLCLECEESLEFPRNRAELYERGLKVLLSKWDASRKVQRDQFYEKLSINRKEDLLSQLALKTFEQKDYFFKQRTVEHHIADYIINLPDARTDPKALQLDSEAALKSIEAQHGLLVERAKGIYSFSHLTFQEYFTAKQIVNEADYERLVTHLTEKRWREVFLLTANIMPKADRLLLVMKQSVDAIVAVDDTLQRLLQWLSQKSNSIKVSYKPGAVRAFYFSVVAHRALHTAMNYSHELAFALDTVLARDQEIIFEQNKHVWLTRDETLSLSKKDNNFVLNHAFDVAFYRPFHLDRNLELDRKLQNFRDQMTELLQNKPQHLEKWLQKNEQVFLEHLKAARRENYSIGYNLQCNDQQQQLLKQYYDANKLLIDCLNSDCYVSRDVRQEIEETLLLPIAEIEKRTTDQR